MKEIFLLLSLSFDLMFSPTIYIEEKHPGDLPQAPARILLAQALEEAGLYGKRYLVRIESEGKRLDFQIVSPYEDFQEIYRDAAYPAMEELDLTQTEALFRAVYLWFFENREEAENLPARLEGGRIALTHYIQRADSSYIVFHALAVGETSVPPEEKVLLLSHRVAMEAPYYRGSVLGTAGSFDALSREILRINKDLRFRLTPNDRSNQLRRFFGDDPVSSGTELIDPVWENLVRNPALLSAKEDWMLTRLADRLPRE